MQPSGMARIHLFSYNFCLRLCNFMIAVLLDVASVYDYKASNIDDTYGANGNMCHAQKVNADLRILPTLNDAGSFSSKHVIENTRVLGNFQIYRQNTCKVENVVIFVIFHV